MTTTLKMPRIDIQGLRGFAVLIVALFRTKKDYLQSAFMSADVLFIFLAL